MNADDCFYTLFLCSYVAGEPLINLVSVTNILPLETTDNSQSNNVAFKLFTTSQVLTI